MTDEITDDVFICYADLGPTIGVQYSRIHIRRLMRKGEFPSSFKLSANRIGWRLSDLRKWQASRIRQIASADYAVA
jgi:predicted DNA-binding transcriptional regulator AlpA